MRPLLLTAILIGLAPAAQAQTIVHDPTSYAKLLEQARTSLEQLQRLQTQVEQGQTLLKSLNEASNLGGLAAALESPVL